jgi:mannose-6-phosphate isomerase-like protein (cupin superfamily)
MTIAETPGRRQRSSIPSERRTGRNAVEAVFWKGETMRKAILTLLTVSFAVAPTAQTELPPPGTSLDVTAAERQAIIKAYPGRRGTQMKSIDTGKLVIALWLDQLKGGPGPGTGEMHTEVSEVYVILEGSATLVTGGKLINAKGSSSPGSPTFSGQFEGGLTRQVRAGDVVVNPPGTVHSWKSIDTPTLVYMNVWIDPEKKLPAGYVDPVLTK